MNDYNGRLTVFGDHDAGTYQQIDNVMESGAAYFVECADGHLGYGHPIGGVAAYRDKISLSGAGFDLGCGNTCSRTNLKFDDIANRLDAALDEIVDTVSFGIGRKNKTPVDHEIFGSESWSSGVAGKHKELAREQLGTVGSGNHYVDLFIDGSDESVWVGVHFGSRGFGHKVATHYLGIVGASDAMMSPPALISVDDSIKGRKDPLWMEYISDMSLAGEYAKAGRDWVLATVLGILGTKPGFYVNNHHNLIWRETHHGQSLWVARKGATPAFPGQLGFIGGSMGDDAVIVRGIDSELSRKALYSTVHGAGRVMSRTDARGKTKVDKATGEVRVVKEPRVDRGEMTKWLKDKGVSVRGGDLDEAPQAYRRLPEVLEHHKGTIEVLHTLSPIGVCMAGSDVYDPYKD